MKDFIGQNVIASCENWFCTPDGMEYKNIYGKLDGIYEINKETLGFTPNRPNVNWVYKIGNMIIQGCQIKYMVLCPNKPSFGATKQWNVHEGKFFEYERPNIIYDAS